ncbi:MAG TPA: N-formylglutamate amidohydrolase [Longimicrobiales bacterium]|nr:N-formylglutamate amidohydrolase [Longimicrobiales bacterium]
MSAAGRPWSMLVTCEHGGNEVPAEHAVLFAGHEEALRSHRGWDPGALTLARELAARLGAPLLSATVTRLLVDLNRSPHNPRVFSEITRALPPAERLALLERWHRPHWEAVEGAVRRCVETGGRVLHLGVHTFTPVLRGEVRRPDLALLYDPRRPAERASAAWWARALERAAPGRVVARNRPYRGASDGLTTSLRRRYGDDVYLGFELEVNQRHVGPGGAFPPWVAEAFAVSLEEARA